MTDQEAIAEALRKAGVEAGYVGAGEYRRYVAALAAPSLRAHFVSAALVEAAKRIDDERLSVKGDDLAAVNQRAGLHVAGLIVADVLATTE